MFASKFPGQGQTLWTMVNRNEYDVEGRQIEVPYHAGVRFYDVWHGEELKPEVSGDRARSALKSKAHGFGAVLATDRGAGAATRRQLARRNAGALAHAPCRAFPRMEVPAAATGGDRLHQARRIGARWAW